MTPEEISRFLLTLYRELPDRDFDDYMDYVFGLMVEVFRFESGWIGHGELHGDGSMNIEGIHLYRQPPEKLMEYKSISHLDTFAINTGKRPGHVHVWDVERQIPDQKEYAPVRDFVRRFDVRHTLALAVVEPHRPQDTDAGARDHRKVLRAGVSLARYSVNDPFTERDQRLAALLVPHFAQVRTMKRTLVGDQSPTVAPNEWQVLSGWNGCLAACPEGARQLLQMEWPQWEPPVLPPSLMEALRSSSETRFLGRFIAVTGTSVGRSLVLRICSRSEGFTLTAAQREVVHHIVNGLENKEVAKRLNLSDYTVRNHLVAVYRKLGVRNKTELALRWHASPASRR